MEVRRDSPDEQSAVVTGEHSIFSLKNEPEGGSEATDRRASLFGVGFGVCIHKTVVVAVGMWESRRDFQGRWEERETWVWFSAPSMARHFHSAVLARSITYAESAPILRNSSFLASRISRAASVSDCCWAR